MGKTTRRIYKEQDEYELPVSMVDVVFLLLIFFMVASRFKTMEHRLDANLPKDEGQNPMPADIEPPEEIRVYMWVPPGKPDDVAIGLGDRKAANVANLDQLVGKLKGMMAAVGGTNTAVVIDARKNVKFKYVIGALDACGRAEIEDVKFQAPAVPGGGGHNWWHQ